RHGDVLGEGAVPVHADAHRVAAEVALARPAVAAVAAGDVALGGDALALGEAGDRAAQPGHLAGELVAHGDGHRHRLLRPLVPAVDVDVRAADGRLADADQHVVGPHLRHRDLLHPQPRLRLLLHQRLHFTTPSSRPTLTNASTARSRCGRWCAALIWVRMRAWPCGTTG